MSKTGNSTGSEGGERGRRYRSVSLWVFFLLVMLLPLVVPEAGQRVLAQQRLPQQQLPQQQSPQQQSPPQQSPPQRLQQQTGGDSSAQVSRAEVTAADRSRAVQRGLDFLAKGCDASGALSPSSFPIAVTALGGMAFLGAGVEYNRGTHGQVLVGAVRYLLDNSTDRGYINNKASGSRRSKMHGHAYAILFLAQVVGTIDNQKTEERVRRTIASGLKIIVRSQTPDGGWGYEPDDHFDEASITVCCLQALRAARDAGFVVENTVIRQALSYLKGCAKPDGSFRYSLARNQTRSTYELTAAAVSTMHAAGQYTNEEHKKGVDFLRRRLERYRRRPLDASVDYRYYGNLYAGQVYFQLGGPDWDGWYPRAFKKLVKEQGGSGAWDDSRFGQEYATSVALLILEIPLGFLPIFER